ncbi:MAG TPA: carboxylesterase/lipase family protein [Herpetosiphonaceae bacterium]
MSTIIETRYGSVQGAQEGSVRVWRGVPFAAPPVGERRYRRPVPPQAWSGVRDATQFGPICPQIVSVFEQQLGEQPRAMSEDCLTLNIWAPGTESRKRPVMVWIHGGAFVSGAGSLPIYDGSNFAQHGDLIVVTVNYRLGPFGFLYLHGLTDDPEYAANLGLLDQIAALTWVRDNIAAFGGDPEHITIFGESAGAMSIAALLAMPEAQGLYQQAILQSGAAQVQLPEQASAVARAILEQLGVTPDNLDALRSIPGEIVLQTAIAVQSAMGGGLIFLPVLDGATLPAHPVAAIQSGSARNIPVLIGTNRDEGNLFVTPDTPPSSRDVLATMLRSIVGPTRFPSILGAYAESVAGQAELFTDIIFWIPALQLAEPQQAQAPVWMYRFDWESPSPEFVAGAFHALELPFVWDHLDTPAGRLFTGGAPGPQQLADPMHRAWIAFARTGNPGIAELPEWPQYDLDTRATMIFNSESRVEHDPQAEKRRLWLDAAQDVG